MFWQYHTDAAHYRRWHCGPGHVVVPCHRRHMRSDNTQGPPEAGWTVVYRPRAKKKKGKR